MVGLKPDQAHLYRSCTLKDLFETADYERVDAKVKKHGRVEQRRYRSFTLRTCWGGFTLAKGGSVYAALCGGEPGKVRRNE